MALARPVPVPDVRAAASGVLGTSLTRHVALAAIVPRKISPRRLSDGNSIEDPMLVTTAMAVLALLTLCLSMDPDPRVAALARS